MPSPTKTAPKTKKTTPMPDESRAKSTIATTKNKTPAAMFPKACLDTPPPYRRQPTRRSWLSSAHARPPADELERPIRRESSFDVSPDAE